MIKEHLSDSVTVHRTTPLKGEVQIGPSKHASNALAGAFPLADKVIVPLEPTILDFQRYMNIYKSLGAVMQNDGSQLVIDNTRLDGHIPDQSSVRDVRASILLLSGALLRTGRIQMPIPEGDWPGTRPTSSVFDVVKEFGGKVDADEGMVDVQLDTSKSKVTEFDVKGKVFATLAGMILATGVGGKTTIHNPLSSLEVDNLADTLIQMGAEITGLDSQELIVESEGMNKLKKEVVVNIAPDACETMFWLAYSKLHNLQLEMHFQGWDKKVDLKNWGPLFDMSKLVYYTHMMVDGENSVAVVHQQDIKQLEPINIVAFHDKKGLPRDAAPVLAVLFGALDAISSYYDEKYGARRTDWMRELRKIGGRIDYFSKDRATIWGNGRWGYGASVENTVLYGSDIRSTAALLLAASTSEVPVTVVGLKHVARSYTKLLEKMGSLGTEVVD